MARSTNGHSGGSGDRGDRDDGGRGHGRHDRHDRAEDTAGDGAGDTAGDTAGDRAEGTWATATALLAGAGLCAECGGDRGHAAFERASQALMRVIEAVGPGSHHLVCSVSMDTGPLIATLHAQSRADTTVRMAESAALTFCSVLAAGLVAERPGGVVVRTHPGAVRATVRAWSLLDGWLQPLTAAEVFTAYCTDAVTGEPVPPEPGVDHRPGLPLPPPEEADR